MPVKEKPLTKPLIINHGRIVKKEANRIIMTFFMFFLYINAKIITNGKRKMANVLVKKHKPIIIPERIFHFNLPSLNDFNKK